MADATCQYSVRSLSREVVSIGSNGSYAGILTLCGLYRSLPLIDGLLRGSSAQINSPYYIGQYDICQTGQYTFTTRRITLYSHLFEFAEFFAFRPPSVNTSMVS